MANHQLFGLAENRTDIWSTPQDFFEKLHAVFNFDLDVCALSENAKCERFFSPADDGLKQPLYALGLHYLMQLVA